MTTEHRHMEIAQLFRQLEVDFPEPLGAFKKLSHQLESDGAISATSPLGTLNAGSMHLTQAGETSHVLVFNDGVKLIYRPQTP